MIKKITILKPCIILLLFGLLFTTKLQAQVDLFGFGGYMTYSSVPVREGDL